MDLHDKFYSKFNVGNNDDCWLWTGGKVSGGYGLISHKNKKYYAHRLAWEIHSQQSIEKGKVIMHTCDTPACVNPNHLVMGTQQQNVTDMIKKGRQRTCDLSGANNPMAIVNPDDIPAIFKADGAHKDISIDFGYPIAAVQNIRNRKTWRSITEGLTAGKRGLSGTMGSKHSRAVLTEAAAKDIYLSHDSSRLLADKYNCTMDVVQNVRSGRTWRHVTRDLLVTY